MKDFPNQGLAFAMASVVIPAALFAGWTASVDEVYFDPALKNGLYPCVMNERYGAERKLAPMDYEFMHSWFSGPLRSTGEPSLFRSKPADGATTVRLTYLPAFVEPIIVRVKDLYGDQPRLIATRDVKQVHIREGPDHLVRNLTETEVKSIVDLIRSTDVLNLPPDSCLSGVDGHIFLIEANGPDGYRFINRWGEEDGPVYDLSVLMFSLTGWQTGFEDPDRTPEPTEAA